MQRLYHFWNDDQDLAESTWEIINYGKFINQFPSDIIKSIRQQERINTKYVNKNVYIVYIYIYICVCVCVCVCIECLLIDQETGVQSQVKHTKDSKKQYLIPSSLTPRIIRYVLRVKWSNPGKRSSVLLLFPLSVVAIEKGTFGLPSTLQSPTLHFMYNGKIHYI